MGQPTPCNPRRDKWPASDLHTVVVVGIGLWVISEVIIDFIGVWIAGKRGVEYLDVMRPIYRRLASRDERWNIRTWAILIWIGTGIICQLRLTTSNVFNAMSQKFVD